MRSVIVGAILLLFAFVFIARAADADDIARAADADDIARAADADDIARAADADDTRPLARPLANCWAYDADGFNYPTPDEAKCFDTPAKAKAAALASCRKYSEKKATCKVVTCGWCGQD